MYTRLTEFKFHFKATLEQALNYTEQGFSVKKLKLIVYNAAIFTFCFNSVFRLRFLQFVATSLSFDISVPKNTKQAIQLISSNVQFSNTPKKNSRIM